MNFFLDIQTAFANLFRQAKDKGAKNETINPKFGSQVITPLHTQGLDELLQARYQWRDYSNTMYLATIYNSINTDPIISSAITSRLSKALSKLITTDLEGNKTDIYDSYFSKAWFETVCKEHLKSLFFGYSANQVLFGKNYEFSECLPIDRTLYNPLRHSFDLWNFQTDFLTDRQAYDMGLLVSKGNINDALFEKIAAYVILKRETVANWDNYNRKFGTPTTIVQLSDTSSDNMQRIKEFHENLGSNAFGVLSTMDNFEMHSANTSDSYKLYLEFIAYFDKNINSIILGSDTQSTNYSEADSKDENLEGIVRTDRNFLLSFLNGEFQRFIRQYKHYAALPDFRFAYDKKDGLPPSEQIKIDQVLLNSGYKLDIDYLQQRYSVVIDSTTSEATPAPEAKKKVFELAQKLYESDCCGHDHNHVFAKKSLDLGKLNLIIAQIALAIYDQKDYDFSEDLATYYSTLLLQGYELGYNQPDKKTELYIKQNLFKFSAAKTIQEIKEFKTLLLDSNGKTRPFTEFRQLVIDASVQFNENWLQTEYDMTYTVAQQTRVWADGKGFKFIRYRTIGDSRVRPEHQALNGITLKASDSFWNSYTPPNGWRCRCTIEFLNEAENVGIGKDYEKLGELSLDNKALFGKNFAKSKDVFGSEHPYFSGLTEKEENILLDFSNTTTK